MRRKARKPVQAKAQAKKQVSTTVSTAEMIRQQELILRKLEVREQLADNPEALKEIRSRIKNQRAQLAFFRNWFGKEIQTANRKGV